MQNLNESLQAKYPHLELAILPLSQVNKDNESKRIDSEYFKKEYLENEERLLNLNSVKLGKICSFICNGDDCRDYKENGLKYIRTGDIKEYGLDLCNCATIRDDFISNIKLEIGDLLVTRKGNYGKSQVVNNIEILKSIVSSEIFQIKLKDINPYFVDVFLKTKFGQMQFEKNIHGVSNFSVTQESLLNFLIPLFPKPFQLEIEKLVKQSHEALEDSKRLYKEAQELLYKELELDFKNPLESLLKSSLQAKKASELAIINDISKKYPHLNISVRPLSKSLHKSGRLDSEYYQSKYDLMETKIKSFSHKKLGELVSIQKSIEPGSEAYQDEGIEFVRVANLGKFGLSKSDIYLNEQDFSKELKKLAPKKETILLSKDGSIGISYCLEEDLECITSGAILHLKVKDKREILPQVLSLILNSIVVKLQAERDAGGSIISHWKISEIEKVLIPLFDFKLQEQIALKIQKSFTLRAKSKDLLEYAKIKVEQNIQTPANQA